MGWPTIAVEFDMFNGPLTALASNTWNDRVGDVKRFSIRRGRQNELGRIEAGQAFVTLDNTTREYNPLGAFGHAPGLAGIQPMRKIRISAVWSAVTYRLFTGYVTAWPPEYPGGMDAEMTLQCVDAFKYFALKKLNGAYASEFTGDSIGTWLTNINWPAADRQIFAGQSQIQAGTFVNTPALEHFRNVEAVENGVFFVDGQGRPTFHNRFYRLTNSGSAAAIFGDTLDDSEVPYLNFTSSYDDTYIYNEARITRTGGTEQVAEDTTSQADFFTRTYTKTLPLLTDNEALGLAEWIVGRYADPLFRFTAVTLSGYMNDSTWPHILGRSIGERVTINARTIDDVMPPVGTMVTQDCFIEGIAHTVDPENARWECVFQLSPADSLTYWVLDSTTLSKLGTTTRLAY